MVEDIEKSSEEIMDNVIEDQSKVGDTIISTSLPKSNPEVDETNSLARQIIDSAESSDKQLDYNALNSFLDTSRERSEQYAIIDQMCQDSIPAAALELYTEDCTASNIDKKIVWATSDDPMTAKRVNYLIDALQINKNIYKWVNSFIKYGDLYVRLYRQSEYDIDPIFSKRFKNDKNSLNEDIKLHLDKENDHFVNYVEMVDNPASMFDLTRFGKTAGFIHTTNVEAKKLSSQQIKGVTDNYYTYAVKERDIDIYGPTQFVHATLSDNVDRVTEEVQIILDKENNYLKDKNTSVTYKVKSGQSIFYNLFRIWRELSLLETSLILNRLTKSSITRVIQVETGNMAKEEVQQVLQHVKQMIEQKAAFNPGSSMSEYNNPGPVDNNIYTPTHDGKGQITTTQIGGDYDPKQLTDLDYFKNKWYGSLGIPKQYFGDTDDGAGFNGGQSLSIISSKYAKKVIKVQTAMCQMITSLINIFLLDRGNRKDVNNFTINMVAPTTQEDLDRAQAETNKLGVIRDVMDMLSDIEDPKTKLAILKQLLVQINLPPEAVEELDNYIKSLDNKDNKNTSSDTSSQSNPADTLSPSFSPDNGFDLDKALEGEDFENIESEETGEFEVPEVDNTNDILPTPEETGVDLVNIEG